MLGGHHEEKMTNSLLNMHSCTVVNARVLFVIKVEFIINTTATNILKAYTKLGGWIFMHKNRQLSKVYKLSILSLNMKVQRT